MGMSLWPSSRRNGLLAADEFESRFGRLRATSAIASAIGRRVDEARHLWRWRASASEHPGQQPAVNGCPLFGHYDALLRLRRSPWRALQS